MARRERGGEKSGRKLRIGRLLSFPLVIFTLLSAILLITSFLAQYISPDKSWFFAFMGMGAPILYFINFILLLLWTIIWKWYAFVPLAALLICIGGVRLFVNPSIKVDYSVAPSNAIKVMSLNSMGLVDNSWGGDRRSSLDTIVALVRLESPDILCLQEFRCNTRAQKKRIDSLMGLQFNSVAYKSRNDKGGGMGVAVYSKYPIVESGELNFENSSAMMQWVDIVTRSDTIRVFNNHLQTTSITETETGYIESREFITDDGRKEKVKGIASKLRRNFAIRAQQSKSIALVMEQTTLKKIICGDLNDTPMSYTYRKIRGNNVDSFIKKGKGFANNGTYKGLFGMLRIDFVFHSPDLVTHSYRTSSTVYSDHKAVIVVLKP